MDQDGTTPETFTFDETHTPDAPYCSDSVCWCHISSTYHSVVLQPLYTDQQIEMAYTFFDVPYQRERK